MIYFCTKQNRRTLVLQHPTLNGIDYLEVCQSEPDCGCGRKLLLTFLKDARNLGITPQQVLIAGGAAADQSATPVEAITVTPPNAGAPTVVTVTLNEPGDFSTFTLTLVADASSPYPDPPDGIDPQLASVEFSFKAGCGTVADCLPGNCCPPPASPKIDINYMAKDFDAFVQVMRDRMAVIAPGTLETHPSDFGVALVELMAYAADRLSYRQDAVGTEAYIGTARSRISLRRHSKLVDYTISEGSNARTWVFVKLQPGATAPVKVPAGTQLFPNVPGLAPALSPASREAIQLISTSTLGFTTMADATLYQEQDDMPVYTWSDTDCCLATGALEATLKGSFLSLHPGDVLIFEEVKGPLTGDDSDADPAKRWAVRLTGVQFFDYRNRPLVDPLDQTPITNIRWGAADALPFPICLSSESDEGVPVSGVSIVHGNNIPADHGLWQPPESLDAVPPAPPAPVTASSCTCGGTQPVDGPLPRYTPQLSKSPLTFALPFDPTQPASAFVTATGQGVPQLTVTDDRNRPWKILGDLLSSQSTDTVAVVEIERDNNAYLRFGDGQYGAAPDVGMTFTATYRAGNGASGNIGRDSLGHIVLGTNAAVNSTILAVRNPLPGAGGVDPESMEHIRQQAPFSFQTQLRAVTEDDYGNAAAALPGVREARGTLRWTGSWYTAFVSLDPTADGPPGATLLTSTENSLELLRMAGVDLDVEGAIIVGLRLEMSICVDTDHFRSDVEEAVRKVFTSGNQCTGQPGILNPANFSFGQTIYASPLIAAAQTVEGVTSSTLTVFERMDAPSDQGLQQGYLTMGRTEIARCDNDPNRLDHGIFVLHMDGGK